MNRKNIKSILAKKFNAFVDSIEDTTVKRLVKENSIITGGCIVSMLMKEKINDFDIYFTNKETALAVAEYYVKKFLESHKDKFNPGEVYVKDMTEDAKSPQDRIKIFIRSVGVAENDNEDKDEPEELFSDELSAMDYLTDDEVKEKEDAQEKPKYRPLWLSANAISLSEQVQLIIRFYGDPETIHANYDFVHCTSYWLSNTGELVLRPEALEAILAKELRYIGSRYPVCSIIRTRKFLKRGFTINAGQYLKMCLQVSQLNLLDLKTLEDQLIGVDSAYFNQVIDYFKDNPDKLDSAYLVEVINRIF